MGGARSSRSATPRRREPRRGRRPAAGPRASSRRTRRPGRRARARRSGSRRRRRPRAEPGRRRPRSARSGSRARSPAPPSARGSGAPGRGLPRRRRARAADALPAAAVGWITPSTWSGASSNPPASSVPAAAAKTTPGSVSETSTPARSGPASVPRLSIVEVAPLAAISSSGVRASEGSTACMRRPEERRGDPDHAGEREDEYRVAAGEDRRGRSGQRGGADQRRRDQDALAPEAVAEAAGERRDDRRREHPREAREPDRRGPAGVVGEDAERDEVRPLGDDRRAPGELDPPQVAVPHHRSERRSRLCRTAHAAIARTLAGRSQLSRLREPRIEGDR